MNFFRRLFSRPLRIPPYIDLPPGYWTQEDAAAWLSFRGTPAGRKLGTILSNQVTRSAVAATSDKMHTAHSCGVAVGIHDAVRILDSLLPEQTLSPASAQSGATEESGEGTDLFEHLQP